MSDQKMFENKNLEAFNKIKASLFVVITNAIREYGLTQNQVSKITGITQPRVSNLMKGHTEKFSIDMLINVALKLGAKPNDHISNDASSYTVELSF